MQFEAVCFLSLRLRGAIIEFSRVPEDLVVASDLEQLAQEVADFEKGKAGKEPLLQLIFPRSATNQRRKNTKRRKVDNETADPGEEALQKTDGCYEKIIKENMKVSLTEYLELTKAKCSRERSPRRLPRNPPRVEKRHLHAKTLLVG